jgi:hypothetical protein
LGERVWHRVIDTSQQSPDDIRDPSAPAPELQTACRVDSRSVVVLEGR